MLVFCRVNIASFDYIYSSVKSDIHVASISGGTDIISCFVLGNIMSPVYRGEIQGPGLAMDVGVYDGQGQQINTGSGELVCRKPFPSMPVGFWNDPDGKKYHNAYFNKFENIWCHGDWIEKTTNDGFIIHGVGEITRRQYPRGEIKEEVLPLTKFRMAKVYT